MTPFISGHHEVHQNDIRLQRVAHLNGLLAAGHVPDQFQIIEGIQHIGQPATHDIVIIYDQDSNNLTHGLACLLLARLNVIWVPFPDRAGDLQLRANTFRPLTHNADT